MKQLIAIAVAAAGTLSQVGAAAAAPSWCKDASFDGDVDLADLASKDPVVVMTGLAHAACAPSAESRAHAADIEAAHASWGQRFGMVEGDWADVIAYVNAGGSQGDHALTYSTKDFAQFTPIDQYKAIVDGFRIDDGNNGTADHKDAIYYADVFDQHLSEVARFGYIAGCMGDNDKGDQPPAAEWAVCQEDVARFDLAKFNDQLRADTAHTGDQRQRLRFAALRITFQIKQQAQDVAAAQAQDPVYKQMFAVATKARAEWAATLGTESSLLALALKLDSARVAGSRKQFAGCEAETAAALAAQVAKVPAAQFKKMHDVRFDPSEGFAKGAGPILAAIPAVSLAAMPYILCQPTSGTGDFLAYYLSRTAGFRGPRTTVLSRLLDEKFVLDDMNAKIRWAYTDPLWTRSGGVMTSAGGLVASTKLDGNRAIVTLDKLLVKTEQCTQSHDTNKISEILSNGQIMYQSICDKTAIVTEDQQWDPFKVRKAYAAVLKKGVKFSAVNAHGDDELGMDVIAIWPSAKAEVPSWLLGAEIK